jgi:uncharacterized protein (TIGR03435 family)
MGVPRDFRSVVTPIFPGERVSWFCSLSIKQLKGGIDRMRAPLLCLVLAGMTLLSRPALAQVASSGDAAPPAKPAALPTAYDIVSVRPHKEDNSRVGSYWRHAPSGFSANVPVYSLITGAYNVMMEDQISGLPDWARTENFDIEAKLDPDNAEAVGKLHGDDRVKENALLLRALLADRFRMKAHIEVKELPVYNLVVAKSGLKMKEAVPDQSPGFRMGLGSIAGQSLFIGNLVGSLSHPAGRLIIDKTGLTGKYQVDLTWAWGDDPNATGPSLFTALQEQLGLKLEPAKAPLDVVVIDHIERPSEN